MRIALATCAHLPTWEVDDLPLIQAFEAAGALVERPAWDDPRVVWQRFDAVLIRTTWDYHRRRDAFVAWAREVDAATTLLNPASIVQWNSHKSYLRDLEARGVSVVPTEWIEQPRDVAALVRAHGWRRGFLKPIVGATAEGTLPFDADAAGLAVAQAHADQLLVGGGALLQPFLDVATHGERSAIAVDGQVTHFVRKDPPPGDYRVQDDYGATDAPHVPSESERAFVDGVLGAIPDVLAYARVDWLLDARGEPRLVELELIEPSLFLRHGPGCAPRLVEAVTRRLSVGG